jgi:hypothetical protein
MARNCIRERLAPLADGGSGRFLGHAEEILAGPAGRRRLLIASAPYRESGYRLLMQVLDLHRTLLL